MVFSKRLVFILSSILILLLPTATFGVSEHVLPNGLKILVEEDHKSPLAIFQIWYRVGSRDEISGRAGISHLLEHMMFKGTLKYGSKVLSKTVQRYGGTDNAFTSRDYTAYFQILPSDRINLSIDFESDRMTNLILDEKETLSERSVVMEERRMRTEDDPQNSLFEEAMAAAFNVHPYRRPVIGWRASLASISRQDLVAYYREYYSPDNAFIVVVGDVNTDELIEKMTKIFSGIARGSAERESYVVPESPQHGERRVYLKREAELPDIISMFHVPVLPDNDAYALDVLNMVLSGGKSSRLYKALVYDKKLALSASSDYDGTYKDPFLFFLEATAAPGADIDELERNLYAEVDRIKAEPPSEFELQKAKNQIEADFIMGQDSIFFQAMVIGRFEIVGDWRLKDKYIQGIRSVTADDVQRVANAYLMQDNRTVGVLIPQEKKKDSMTK